MLPLEPARSSVESGGVVTVDAVPPAQPALAPYRRVRLSVPHWARRAAPRRVPAALFVAPDGWKSLAFACITIAGLALGDGLVGALGKREGYCAIGDASHATAPAPTGPTLASYSCARFDDATSWLWVCCPFVVLALALAAVSDPGLAATPTGSTTDAELQSGMSPRSSSAPDATTATSSATTSPALTGVSIPPPMGVASTSDRSSSSDGGDDVDAPRPKAYEVHPQAPYTIVEAPDGRSTTRGTCRLVHCRYCGVGVRHFDHHCVVLGICVGRANMGAFVLATTLYSLWLSAALWACTLGLCALYGAATPLDNDGQAVLPALWGVVASMAISVVEAIANGFRTFSFSGAVGWGPHIAGIAATFLFDMRAAFVAVALFVLYMWMFCCFLTLRFWGAVCAGTDTVEGRRKRSREAARRLPMADGALQRRPWLRRLRALVRSLAGTRLASF